jgi:hypothetical protein
LKNTDSLLDKQTMRHLRQNILLVGALFVFCAGCNEPPEPPTPTRLPHEPAVTYSGTLGEKAGKIALIVTATRAQALICTLDGNDWRTLDGWLTHGTRSESGGTTMITVEGPQAKVTAAMAPLSDSPRGTYTAPNGQAYAFTMRRLVDPDQIASGAQEGIYRYDALAPPGVEGKTLLALIVDNAQQGDLCGMLFNKDDQPISRVTLEGIWQAGFGLFNLPDLLGSDGKPILWRAPGRFGHIDAIALP